MKKFLFLLGLGFAALCRAQTTQVINTAVPPSYPVGSTNVPLSLDTAGRVVLSTGSVSASLLDPAQVRGIVLFSIPPPDSKKVAVADEKKKSLTDAKIARQ